MNTKCDSRRDVKEKNLDENERGGEGERWLTWNALKKGNSDQSLTQQW